MKYVEEIEVSGTNDEVSAVVRLLYSEIGSLTTLNWVYIMVIVRFCYRTPPVAGSLIW